MPLSSFFDEQSNVDIGKSFIAVLAKIEARAELGIDSLEGAIESLEGHLEGTLGVEAAEQVNGILAEVGVTPDDLRERLAKLKEDLLKKIPNEVRTLFKPLSEVRGEHAWPVFTGDEPLLEFDGGGTFALAGTASLSFGLEAIPQGQIPQHFELQALSSDQALLRYGLDASISGEAEGSTMFSYGTLEAGADASLGVELDYYFRHSANRLLIAAAADDIIGFPSPFDLQNIERVSRSEQGDIRLDVIRLQVAGSARLSAALQAGKVWGFQHATTNVADENVNIAVGASASVDLSAQLARKGDFSLLVSPPAEDGVLLTLRANESQEFERSVNLNAGLQVSGLDRVLGPLVEAYLPDPGQLMEKLGEFKDPGAWLAARLGETELITDSELGTELLEALLGEGDAKSLNEILAARVEAAVNELGAARHVGEWTGRANELALELLGRAGESLDLPLELKTSLANKAKAQLGKLIKSFSEKLLDRIGKIKGEATDVAKELEILQEIDDKFADAAKRAQAKAEELLAPVEKLIARYQEIRRKFAVAAEGAAKLQLAVAAGLTARDTEGGEALLKVVLDPARARARACYRRMLRGDFSAVMEAHWEQQADSAIDHGVRVIDGRFRRLAQKVRQLDLSVHVFGKSFAARKLLSTDIDVSWDIDGNILACAAGTRISAVARAMREQQSASFATRLSMVAEGEAGEEKLATTAGVDLSYEDESLELKELDEYLESLVDADMITDEVRRAGLRLLKRRFEDRPAQGFHAVVSAAMALDRAQLMRAARRDSGTIRRTAYTNLLTYQPGHDGDDRRSYQQKFRAFIEAVAGGQEAEDYLVSLGETYSRNRINRERTRFENERGRSLIGPREEGMFRRLGTLVRLGTGLAQALAQIRGFDELRGRLDWKQDADRSFQLLREKNDELAEDLSPWFTDNFITLLFRGGVELRTLAFLSTIAQLADMETPMVSVLAFVAADGTKQEFLLA